MTEFVTGLARYATTGMVYENTKNVSRTNNINGKLDYGVPGPALRAFFWCSVFPPLAVPIAGLHAVGTVNAARTIKGREKANAAKAAIDPTITTYGVMKRFYDQKTRRIHDACAIDDGNEIDRVVKMSKGRRNEFFDDPISSGTQYYVAERKQYVGMSTQMEGWTLGFLSDCVRYMLPIGVCYLFKLPILRFVDDSRLVAQGKLVWRQMRHPILNFFRTAKEHREATHRLNTTKPFTRKKHTPSPI